MPHTRGMSHHTLIYIARRQQVWSSKFVQVVESRLLVFSLSFILRLGVEWCLAPAGFKLLSRTRWFLAYWVTCLSNSAIAHCQTDQQDKCLKCLYSRLTFRFRFDLCKMSFTSMLWFTRPCGQDLLEA